MTTPDRPADVTALRDALLIAWHANAEPSDAASWFADDLAAFEAAVRDDATRAADAEVAGLRADNERMTRELEAWNSIPRWSNQRLENAMTTSGHELVIDGSQFLCPTEPVWFEDWDTAARHIARVAVAALAAQPAAPEAEPERCACCHGDGFVDCRDGLECLRPRCDGYQHDCRECHGAGEAPACDDHEVEA